MASGIPLIPEYFLDKIETWADKRQSETGNTAIIDRHHLYILPSRSGLFFFFMLLVIFIGAINYENNMAFLLCFLLASISLVSMIYTHLNIHGIKIQALSPDNIFAGQEAGFPVRMEHDQSHYAACIKIEADDNRPVTIMHLSKNTPINLLIPVKSKHRGVLELPRIKVYSEYPLGLFYAWSWIKLSADCLVYPEPDDSQHTLKNLSDTHNNGKKYSHGQDDFDHLREYKNGDHPAHIAWKTYARNGELYTKTFQSAAQAHLWIDWFGLDNQLSVEKRLAILCRQILDASQHGYSYGLRLPDQEISVSSGQQHRNQCLGALALFSI